MTCSSPIFSTNVALGGVGTPSEQVLISSAPMSGVLLSTLPAKKSIPPLFTIEIPLPTAGEVVPILYAIADAHPDIAFPALWNCGFPFIALLP